MTHDELVRLAFNWLRRGQRCSLVVSELVTSAIEVPDAIGWRGGFSFLIECKVSISDLRADLKKGFRDPRTGMGTHRYYMVTPDIWEKALEIIPKGWGLLVPEKKVMRVRRESETFYHPDRDSEVYLLLSVVRRIAGREEPLSGVGVRCYRHELSAESPAHAILSIADEI